MAATMRPFAGCASARASPRVVVAAAMPENAGAKFCVAMVAGVASLSLIASPADAAFRMPPIDKDPNRCERAYVGNTIGQANAVSDRTLDLRQCQLKGANLSGKVLSGAFMSDADFSEVNMTEAVLTKAYCVNTNFENANLTNAVVDRVDFDGSNMRGVQFINTVITGATFKGTDLTGSSFEDALVGYEDAKRLCANPTLVGESRVGVGCRNSPGQ